MTNKNGTKALVLRFLTIILVTQCSACAPQSKSVGPSNYVFLLEDDLTLKESGASDYRSMYAQVLELLKTHEAHSAALKFFFFDEGAGTSDELLAAKISSMPVLLQYALRGDVRASIAPDMIDKMQITGSVKDIAGFTASDNIQLPMPAFSAAASHLGFVDIVEPFSPNMIPLVGLHEGIPVKSLALQLLEQHYGSAALKESSIKIAGSILAMDSVGRTHCDIKSFSSTGQLSMTEMLAGDSSNEVLAGKSVIVGYEGSDSPMFKTGLFSKLSAHRLFYARLVCLEQQLLSNLGTASSAL